MWLQLSCFVGFAGSVRGFPVGFIGICVPLKGLIGCYRVLWGFIGVYNGAFIAFLRRVSGSGFRV